MLAHKLATDANAGNLDGGDDYYAHGWPRWRPCCRAVTLPASGNRTDGGRLARAYLETPHGTRSGWHAWMILLSGRLQT